MAIQNISIFTDNRLRDKGMVKTFEIDITNITANGTEEVAELEALDLDDLKMLKRELENSIELEKKQSNDIRISNAV